jgi:Tsi6
MNRLGLLTEALAKSKNLQEQFPEVQTIGSIIRQLEYLIGVESGVNDRSRLDEIILGVQAAREIEPLDGDLAELLYQVNDVARTM